MELPNDVLATINMNSKTTIASSEENLSEYERIRMEKIMRNNAKLRSLGLMTQQEEEQSNARAAKSAGSKKSNVPSKQVARPATVGARSSLRLRGLPPQRIGNSNLDKIAYFYKTEKKAKKNFHNTMNNRTATYEHCAMRIRTMTHAQLRLRIRMVEQALGKNCLVKLQIMVQCFRDHDLHDLAELAEDALKRVQEPLLSENAM